MNYSPHQIEHQRDVHSGPADFLLGAYVSPWDIYSERTKIYRICKNSKCINVSMPCYQLMHCLQILHPVWLTVCHVLWVMRPHVSSSEYENSKGIKSSSLTLTFWVVCMKILKACCWHIHCWFMTFGMLFLLRMRNCMRIQRLKYVTCHDICFSCWDKWQHICVRTASI